MSSIDVVSLTTQLTNYLNQSIAALKTPITTLQNDKATLQTKSAVFTDLKTKLDALKAAAAALSGTGSSSTFGAKAVTSSNTNLVTCSATSDAVSGTHSVFVNQLATAHMVVSNRYDQQAVTLSQGNSGTKTFSISVGQETYQVSVTIAAGDTNETVLSKVASAINQATDGEVGASTVRDTPSTAKLSVRSASTGTAGKMTFVDTSGLLGTLGLTNQSQATNTVGGYVHADLGNNELDAIATVDGLQVISSTNSLDHAVDGLTITLLASQQQGASPISLTVSTGVDSIEGQIKSFLSAYNDAFTYLAAKTKVDSTTYARDVLADEYPYVSLKLNMRQTMSNYIPGLSSSYRALSQIGITSDSAGNFSVTDQALLEKAISSDLSSVKNLFGSDHGIATSLTALLQAYVAPQGTISSSKDMVSTRMDFLTQRITREQKHETSQEKVLRDQYGQMLQALYQLQNSQDLSTSFSAIVGV